MWRTRKSSSYSRLLSLKSKYFDIECKDCKQNETEIEFQANWNRKFIHEIPNRNWKSHQICWIGINEHLDQKLEFTYIIRTYEERSAFDFHHIYDRNLILTLQDKMACFIPIKLKMSSFSPIQSPDFQSFTISTPHPKFFSNSWILPF